MDTELAIVISCLCGAIMVLIYLLTGRIDKLSKMVKKSWRGYREVAEHLDNYNDEYLGNFEVEDRIQEAIETETTGETETRAPSKRQAGPLRPGLPPYYAPGISMTTRPHDLNVIQQTHIQLLQKQLIEQNNLRPQPITLVMTDKEGNQSIVKEFPVNDKQEPKQFKNKKRRLDI
jgi:hypothetical protein